MSFAADPVFCPVFLVASSSTDIGLHVTSCGALHSCYLQSCPKHYAMGTYGAVDNGSTFSWLRYWLVVSQIHASAALTPGRVPGNHWRAGCVGPTAGQHNTGKQEFLTLQGLKLQPSVIHPVASLYIGSKAEQLSATKQTRTLIPVWRMTHTLTLKWGVAARSYCATFQKAVLVELLPQLVHFWSEARTGHRCAQSLSPASHILHVSLSERPKIQRFNVLSNQRLRPKIGLQVCASRMFNWSSMVFPLTLPFLSTLLSDFETTFHWQFVI
jgi:hypothetical protein